MIEGLVTVCPANILPLPAVNVSCATFPATVAVGLPVTCPDTLGGTVPFRFIVNGEPLE